MRKMGSCLFSSVRNYEKKVLLDPKQKGSGKIMGGDPA